VVAQVCHFGWPTYPKSWVSGGVGAAATR
jgi:hypothetical protein